MLNLSRIASMTSGGCAIQMVDEYQMNQRKGWLTIDEGTNQQQKENCDPKKKVR